MSNVPQADIEAIARELGAPLTAIQGWRIRGRVAYRYRLPILERAKELKIELDPAEFDRVSVWFRRE